MGLLDGPAPLEEAAAFAEEQLAPRARRTCARGGRHAARAGRGPRPPRGLHEAARRSRSRAGSATNWACGTWRSGPSAASATWSSRPAIPWRPSGCCVTAGTCSWRWAWTARSSRAAVPLAEALHAQGRDEEANETLKAVKDEWASGDASIAAPRLVDPRPAAGGRRVHQHRAPDRRARAASRAPYRPAVPPGGHAARARRGGATRPASTTRRLRARAEALRISEAKGYAVGSARARMETAQA